MAGSDHARTAHIYLCYGAGGEPHPAPFAGTGRVQRSWRLHYGSPNNREEIQMRLVDTPLLPPGFQIPETRFLPPSQVLRQKMESQPYVFGPGIFDPHGAELVMYHCLDAVYFSGYSFAIGHLGTTDMDLYSSVEIADGARRIVSALRKFQLTMAVGDPGQEVPPRHLEIPPVVA
ncbi:MAG: hypothetical protein M3072_17175, partial [Candidatus Dormibacteraeota bacterium]|nr:hypothetical protein [Candidatus Dormibacteraeota bacterium]